MADAWLACSLGTRDGGSVGEACAERLPAMHGKDRPGPANFLACELARGAPHAWKSH